MSWRGWTLFLLLALGASLLIPRKARPQSGDAAGLSTAKSVQEQQELVSRKDSLAASSKKFGRMGIMIGAGSISFVLLVLAYGAGKHVMSPPEIDIQH